MYIYCLLEIHLERKIFQYLMKSILSLITIMSITQAINKSEANCTTNSNYPLWGTFF